MKVALVGCTHGELDAIYARVDELNAAATAPDERIQLLICCGDFESLRNSHDLKSIACPPKYRHMNAFHEYYRGEKRASVLTVFIGGNHEGSNYLQELQYGGWVAPRIFYLGAAGVINVAGMRIAGISGIYQAKHYRKGRFERVPYNRDTVKSVYCVREYEVYQLAHLQPRSSNSPRLDAFLSHDWPTHIENHGDIGALLASRPDFKHSIESDRFGSPGSEQLLRALRPTKWLAGHMHIRFEAHVEHSHSGGDGSSEREQTHFLALSKCFPGEACLEVLDIPAASSSLASEAHDGDGDVRVLMDAEWLAILRATHHLASSSRASVTLPAERMPIDVAWVEQRFDEVFGSEEELLKRSSVRGEWMADFEMTVPPLGEERTDAAQARIGNPQTDAFLALLQLPHVVTIPFVRQ